MKREVVRVVDDLDGTEPAFTVEFGVDRRNYEIDLSEENLARFREVMTPYLNASRRKR